jgi:hypothetical protein
MWSIRGELIREAGYQPKVNCRLEETEKVWSEIIYFDHSTEEELQGCMKMMGQF